MSGQVIVPLPDGRWLGLSAEAFEEALRAGAEFAPPSPAAPVTSEPLLGSEQLAAALGLPASWVEQAAREGRIPSIRCGRYVRFSRSAVEAVLTRSGSGSAT